MIGALFVIGAVITVLVLAARLHETRAQLAQATADLDRHRRLVETMAIAATMVPQPDRRPE